MSHKNTNKRMESSNMVINVDEDVMPSLGGDFEQIPFGPEDDAPIGEALKARWKAKVQAKEAAHEAGQVLEWAGTHNIQGGSNVEVPYDDFEGAIADLEKAVSVRPDDAALIFQRANLHMRLGEYDLAWSDYVLSIRAQGYLHSNKGENDAAIAAFSKVIELAPDFDEAYCDRGVLYMRSEAYNNALRDFERAIELNPNAALFYDNLGIAYTHLENYDQAMASFDQAIARDPDLATAYTSKGFIYNQKHDYEQAVRNCTIAIALNPNFAEAYNNRAAGYIGLKEYGQAMEDSTRAIQLKPDLSDAYTRRGGIYGQLGDYDKAEDDFLQAIRLNPKNPNAYSGLGAAHYSQKRYNEAIQELTRAVEMGVSHPYVYINRANAYAMVDNYEAAFADFSRAISRFNAPDSLFLADRDNLAYSYYGLGLSYSHLGDYDKAADSYATSLAINPSYAEALANRAAMYLKIKLYASAEEDLKASLTLGLSSPDIYNLLGSAYYYQNKFKLAKECYEKAISLKPEHAQAHSNLGATLSEAGKYEDALNEYQVALSLAEDPTLNQVVSSNIEEVRAALQMKRINGTRSRGANLPSLAQVFYMPTPSAIRADATAIAA